MPGLIGFIKPFDSTSGQAFLDKMASTLEKDPEFERDLFIEDGFGAGRITNRILNPEPQPIWDNNHRLSVFFEGELFDREPLFKMLDLSEEQYGDAQLVLNLYKNFDTGFIQHLNGSFLILIWDRIARKAIIMNDRFGTYPLYYAHFNGELVFSSGLRAILSDSTIPRDPDQTAIIEFLIFDHFLNDRTILKSVKLMPQASVLTFHNNNLKIEPYYHFKYRQLHSIRTDQSYIEEMNFLMQRAVKRQMQGALPVGLMLSGGLDSRNILAIMAEISNKPIETFTWSIPGSDDARFARESARVAKANHHFFNLDPDWLLNKGEQAVRITGGNGNIVNLHALAALEQEANYASVIYKGFMGDAMFGFGMRPRFWADYDQETMVDVHLEAYRDYRVLTFDTPFHEDIFSDQFYLSTREEWRNDFKNGMFASGAKQMSDQRSYFDLTQRVPRMTINGVEVVRSKTAVRLPFVDNDLVEFSLSIPPYLRINRDLANRAFIEKFPNYAKIPIAQTHLPMITCAREIWLRNIQFIQWHLRDRGHNKLAGPVSRPYKDYNLWFRTNLRTWVQETLLNSRALNRGYLKPAAIKQIVSDHMAGKNNAVRIGSLMTIELAHKFFID